MIADLTARRLTNYDEATEVLTDASMMWALLNVLEDVHAQSDQVDFVRAARSGLADYLRQVDLSQADLFEHVVDAIEAGNLERFGITRAPED